jgi:tungstate transport system ATP-binding protein
MTTTAYEIDHLSFKYHDKDIVDIDHYQIIAGETLALVGPNGSGKSTLLNLLSFLSAPAAGEVRFFGESVRPNTQSGFRRRVGYLQQHPYLFNTTVIENIELGLKLRKVNRELRHARAQNIIEQLNLGMLANKRAHELSGGEIQKVALARALVLEPEVLIFDEPFTYLDKSFSGELEKLLVSIHENRTQTIIFSSHDHLRAQVIADRVCCIHHGKLTEELHVNLLHGKYSRALGIFHTGNIDIKISEAPDDVDIVAIEPTQIVLSRTELDSSMRNRFRGEVIALHARNDHIEVTVQTGEVFQVIITRSALDDLAVTIGSPVWVSFKSSAIRILR